MKKKKKKRIICSNCGKVKYLPVGSIDSSEEHFLCDDPCDSAYVIWQNSSVATGESRIYVDDFLKSAAAKRARKR